ncbi:hypothetical protein K402DRAFT_241234 [Aulographum hederae CBS 113979]|uniref:Uncharacterized protein n=1 Tax=Aulographum hederae CBS 113979 TaxID=1176131 RepID=A0A6G1GK30_9PEZI|nr:hypothetical protein K402DRAFT_241234 [Aulographum hederae CBS 113979]
MYSGCYGVPAGGRRREDGKGHGVMGDYRESQAQWQMGLGGLSRLVRLPTDCQDCTGDCIRERLFPRARNIIRQIGSRQLVVASEPCLFRIAIAIGQGDEEVVLPKLLQLLRIRYGHHDVMPKSPQSRTRNLSYLASLSCIHLMIHHQAANLMRDPAKLSAADSLSTLPPPGPQDSRLPYLLAGRRAAPGHGFSKTPG